MSTESREDKEKCHVRAYLDWPELKGSIAGALEFCMTWALIWSASPTRSVVFTKDLSSQSQGSPEGSVREGT